MESIRQSGSPIPPHLFGIPARPRRAEGCAVTDGDIEIRGCAVLHSLTPTQSKTNPTASLPHWRSLRSQCSDAASPGYSSHRPLVRQTGRSCSWPHQSPNNGTDRPVRGSAARSLRRVSSLALWIARTLMLSSSLLLFSYRVAVIHVRVRRARSRPALRKDQRSMLVGGFGFYRSSNRRMRRFRLSRCL
jgi:hypothetical protein